METVYFDVYFDNAFVWTNPNDTNRRFVGTATSENEAFECIKKDLAKRQVEALYFRVWEKDNKIIYDYGYHNSKYICVKRTGQKEVPETSTEENLINDINHHYKGIIRVYLNENSELTYEGIADYKTNDDFLKNIDHLLNDTAEGDLFETIIDGENFPEVRAAIEETCFEYALDWWKSKE